MPKLTKVNRKTGKKKTVHYPYTKAGTSAYKKAKKKK